MILSILDPAAEPREFRRPHESSKPIATRSATRYATRPRRHVDLAALTRRLAARLSPRQARGYVPGLTVIRDAVARDLGCSLMRAETLVAQLRGRGYLAYEGRPAERLDHRRDAWRLMPGT